jgi:amino acid transporter
MLTLYGLGTILGAGIYVLLGEVARLAGSAMPVAFVISAVIAAFSALSYAELAARLPRSAGEAAYVEAAFPWPPAAALVGWAVIATGVVSAATLLRGFVGYLDVFVELPSHVVILVLVVALSVLAAWGIAESMWFASAITILEVLGLIGICVVAGDSFATLPSRWPELLDMTGVGTVGGVLAGAFVAFYAFIGFEDMVNVAEEVIEPARTLPRAIITALVLATGLYVIVAVLAILALPVEILAGSDAPMALIMQSRGLSPTYISLVSLFAVINGALIQLIMASRVLYGLGAQNLAWAGFARIDASHQTPVLATAVIAVAILGFALTLSLGRLAEFTSLIALGIFATVNVALLRLKRQAPRAEAFTVPVFVPVTGALLCGGMLAFQILSSIRAWSEAAA